MSLANFLVKAKSGTYASQGEGGEKIYKNGCKEFSFEDENLRYRDRYYGTNPFIGEEVVFENHKAIWVMNYYGQVVSENAKHKEVYGFLKKAMQEIKKERPFRGPTEYVDGDYKYTDSSSGDIDNFTGVEKIYYKGEKVYQLTYYGCSIR